MNKEKIVQCGIMVSNRKKCSKTERWSLMSNAAGAVVGTYSRIKTEVIENHRSQGMRAKILKDTKNTAIPHYVTAY